MRNKTVEQSQDVDIEKVKQTVEKSVKYFNSVFREARTGLIQNKATHEDIREAEIEFAYLIDEIQRGPYYNVPKAINDCEAFIKTLQS